MKKITLLFLFLIGSMTSSFGQFTEGFETGIPATWTVINGGDPNTWVQFTNTVFVIDGTASATITYSATAAHDDYLITPAINVVAGVNDRFSFSARSFDVLYPENFDLLISTSTPDAAGLTTLVENIAPDSSLAEATSYTYDLSAYVGQTIYIGMHSTTDNQWRISVDNVVSDTAPAAAPDCATLTAPLNSAIGIDYTAPVALTWTAPTTGSAPASYDVYLDTNTVPTTLLGTQTALTRSVTGLLPLTTYYWTVIAKNAAGSATACSIFSFTTSANQFAPYCGPLAMTTVEPITSVNFAGIDNVTDATVNGTPAHENFISTVGNVTAGSSYTITLKGNSDGPYTNNFVVFADWNQDGAFAGADEIYTITQTIVGSTGVDAISASQSLSVPPTALVGTTRMRVKKIFGTTNLADPCLGGSFGQVEDYSLAVTAASADSPDYVNLQFPATATITVGGSATVYGRIYEAGLTDVTSGQAPGITAWVGISPIGANTNPNTWTNWVPATFNVEIAPSNNDDEYQASIGAGLLPGTYYYATRFQLNGGLYVYGGINSTNDGFFWDGTTFNSGVLTVDAPPAVTPNCDLTATLLDPTLGGSTWSRPLADGSGLSASGIGVSYHIYGPFNVDTAGSYTFTSDQDYDGFIFVYQNSFDPSTPLVNYLAGNDDSAPGSVITTNLATGTNYYFVTTSFASDDFGTFTTTIAGAGVATCGTLAVPGFNDANFAFYPNPVKNTLNLSYNQEISNVDVYNLLGQKVIATKLNANNGQIEMSSLPNGAYMVKVTSNNQVKTIKVIKQ